MSRIFDALSRTDGVYDDILQPIREQTAEAAATLNHAVLMEESVRAEPPEIPAMAQPAEIREPMPAGTSAAEIRVVAAPASAPDLKTVALRIPRSVPLLPFDGVHEAASEEYRMIRTRILHHPSRPKMFLVSSPCPGDGKTITAINVAGALALKGDAEVLVVDADFTRSALDSVTGIPITPGLGEVLAGQANLDEAIVRAEQLPHLHLLPAGRSNANPAELLDSDAWIRLLETLRRRFGYVVFDSPPVEAVPYYGRLQAACDGMILVIRPDHTGRPELNDALQSIPEHKLLGAVLNCHQRWFLNQKDYRSYGRYYSRP